MKFRYDINFLRSIAVIFVVFYHFGFPVFSGGFIGVDVFFVISGYLMTRIIFEGLEKNSFNIFSFYSARFNRIVPSLLVLCFVLVIAGFFFLIPSEYRTLGKHIASSLSFLSNVIYWMEAGYFDPDSLSKWLLHTWSLSVEWQFYILLPLIMVTASHIFKLKHVKHLLLLLFIIMLPLGMFQTYKDPSQGYFLLHARAWEMLLGAIAFCFPFQMKKTTSQILSILGLILIIIAGLFLDKAYTWPGIYSLFPVVGAYLIIVSNSKMKFWENRYIYNIGKWSYSIYLWHWPLVVIIYLYMLPEYFKFIGLCLSVILGAINYKYIEQLKFANNKKFITLIFSKTNIPVLIVFILSVLIFSTGGAKSRFTIPNELELISKQIIMPSRTNGYCFYSSYDRGFIVDKNIGTECFIGNNEQSVNTLIFGDSYAGQYDPFLNDVLNSYGLKARSISTNWCTASFGTEFAGFKNDAKEQCKLNRSYLTENLQLYDNLFLAMSWGSLYEKGQLDSVIQFIEYAVNLGVNVVVIESPIQYETSPITEWYRSIYFDDVFDIGRARKNEQGTTRAHEKINRLNGIYVIKRESLYNLSDNFIVDGTDIVVPYSLDGGHISLFASKVLFDHFKSTHQYPSLKGYIKL